LDITIEKLIYGGDGLARLPADEQGRRRAVFVPFTLPGEKISAALEDEKAGFARASVEKILEPSPERIEALCPYFQRCGGCQYQHATYALQLQSKVSILRENLQRLGKLELPAEIQLHSASPWNYRNRARLRVRVDSNFALGYLKRSSHELLPVESCPITSPLINRAIAALWCLGRDLQVPAELREIELFANGDDSQLLVELYCESRDGENQPKQSAQNFAGRLRRVLPEVASVHIFSQTIARARGDGGHFSESPAWTLGPGEFRYQTKTGSLRVSAGSFFQVNRFLVDELVSVVCAGRSGDLALDLYAGVGLFSAALAPSFGHIVAVESSQSSVGDLKYNCPPNVKAVRATVEEYLRSKGKRLRPDLVVVDPPRAGLGERVARSLGTLGAPRLTYVSCDPATLARDLAVLSAAGYRLERVHPVDLFPQTYHIETVVELAR
jgi:23S rRNA (uracil1939-C5)-methyltransferase